MNRRRLPKEELAARATGRTRRVVVSLARVTAAVTVASAVVCGAVLGWNNIRNGGRFTVRHVVLSGNERASSSELAALRGSLEGKNIFAVDLSAAARSMEQHPWVAHVRVVRDFPDTLRVAIEERAAAALVSAGGLYAVDRAAVPFKLVTASDHLDLPVISGIPRELLTNPDGSANSAILIALRIINTYSARKISLHEPLSEVRIAEEAGETAFVIYCGDEAVEVKLGVNHGDLEGNLKSLFDRLERVWSEIEERGAKARSIDLGNRIRPDWIPTRLEASAVVPGAGPLKR